MHDKLRHLEHMFMDLKTFRLKETVLICALEALGVYSGSICVSLVHGWTGRESI
jgi:hypothetical protein